MRSFVGYLLALVFALSSSMARADDEVHPVTVRGHASAAPMAENLEPLIADFDRDVREALGAPPKGPISVDVVKDLRAARSLDRPWMLPEWAAGAARPDEGTIVLMLGGRSGRHNVPRVMKHELAHLAVHDAAGGVRVPRWFDEGTARVLAGEHADDDNRALARARIAGLRFDLDALSASFPADSEGAARAYAISGRAITLLVEKHGSDVLARILSQVRAGERFEIAMLNETGVRPWELSLSVWKSVNLWSAWSTVMREVDWAMAIAGLVFVVGAARVRRRRRAQLAAMEDPEEPLAVALVRWRVIPRRRASPQAHGFA
jgi:hypothetical protein